MLVRTRLLALPVRRVCPNSACTCTPPTGYVVDGSLVLFNLRYIDLTVPRPPPLDQWNDHNRSLQLSALFSGDLVCKTVGVTPSNIVILQRRVVENGTVRKATCWLLRVAMPVNVCGRFARVDSELHTAVGKRFLWPLSVDMASKLQRNFQWTHYRCLSCATDDARDELHAWCDSQTVACSELDCGDRVFATLVTPASAMAAPADETTGRPRCFRTTVGATKRPKHTRVIRKSSSFEWASLPDDVANIVLSHVVSACMQKTHATFAHLASLRLVSRSWKVRVDAVCGTIMECLANSVVDIYKGDVEDFETLAKTRNLAHKYGINTVCLLNDSKNPSVFTFARLRHARAPGALPPDVRRPHPCVARRKTRNADARLCIHDL